MPPEKNFHFAQIPLLSTAIGGYMCNQLLLQFWNEQKAKRKLSQTQQLSVLSSSDLLALGLGWCRCQIVACRGVLGNRAQTGGHLCVSQVGQHIINTRGYSLANPQKMQMVHTLDAFVVSGSATRS